ncbi:ACT domain-containing protein ACR10-like [Gossypium australe]|uniref:ACT domain-containing protein ACR n=1 Tax=Gossypium australe TaxID=47621 RepID=A0A5B6V7J0_9ROSI|nr:ACT domain-containing protein ACR10-like [Gossypium australe]
MGILHDDAVIINQSKNEAEPSVITINCPDKTGLGCDLCRILLFFGLTIVRGDVSTDGKWCYIVFWVIPKPIIKWDTCRWELLKNRLMGTCPSCSSAFGISYYSSELQSSMVTDVFLIKLFCYDRKGLSHGKLLFLIRGSFIILNFRIAKIFYFWLNSLVFILCEMCGFSPCILV